MSFRMPRNLKDRNEPEDGATVLEVELLAERAASLGRGGRDVETALARLRAFDETGAGDASRGELVAAAAEVVWGFLVHRELAGLRDREQVIRDYGIPREVLARLGAR